MAGDFDDVLLLVLTLKEAKRGKKMRNLCVCVCVLEKERERGRHMQENL